MALTELIERGQLWRAQDGPGMQAVAMEPSGLAALDAQLVGGGWQRGQLVELLCNGEGGGELRLLWPLLRRLSAQETLVLWIDPPYHPYALALQQAGIDLSRQRLVRTRTLKQRLWALEQALNSGSCALVLGWLDATVPGPALRRLQLAASEGDTLGWIFRPPAVAGQSSAAAYRLRLQPGQNEQQVELELLKRRGGWPVPALSLALPLGPLLPLAPGFGGWRTPARECGAADQCRYTGRAAAAQAAGSPAAASQRMAPVSAGSPVFSAVPTSTA